jgi:NodT family efflux transporter outer membrane factor (OMF) lipoprotein
MNSARLLTTFLGAAALASCAGSQYREREIPEAGKGAFVSGGPSAFTQEAPADQWWKLYADPRLDALVERALTVNTDLRVAEANLRVVRATLGEARVRSYLPATTATASAQRGRASANTISGATALEPEKDTYSAGLDVSFEVDFFGRGRHGVAALKADRFAAVAARDVVRVSVAAETARAFADACSYNAQLAVALRTVGFQQNTRDLTQKLFDAGRGNGLDIARASALYENARAAAPAFAAARDAALFRLATLVGVPPAEAPQEARACTAPPQLTEPVPIGDGAGLLARRPDVRQAERALKGAAERVGVATADLFPTIRFGGNIGVTAPTQDGLNERTANSYSFGPLLSWSFPNVFGAHARIRQASGRADAALATFDKTVLNALQETETALSDYANELDRRNALQRARDQSAEAARLAQLRFDAGADSFLTLLDAQRSQAQADAALAASEAQTVSKQITLFKALGGGWREAPPVKR